MGFARLKNLKLSTKFSLMVVVTVLLVSFLYGSFYLSFSKHNQYGEAMDTLNGLNQHLLEAALKEKVFLKDASQSSFDEVVDSISQAKREISSLRSYRVFKATDIDALSAELDSYSSSFEEFSKVVQALDGLDKEVVEVMVSFSDQSNAIIGAINEYESECQIMMEEPNRDLVALRDVAKTTLLGVNEVFSVLKSDLQRGDLKSFAAKNAEAIKKLETGKDNVAAIRARIVDNTQDKKYFDYIAEVGRVYDFMLSSTSRIYQLSEQKYGLESKFDDIRRQVAISKMSMLSTGKEKMQQLQRNVVRTNFAVFCVILLVVTLGGFFLIRSVVKSINRLVYTLNESSDRVASASAQVSDTSQQMAEGASEQAAAIEETSSALEEMSSMTKQNAEHAGQCRKLMQEAHKIVGSVNDHMNDMAEAIRQSSRSSEETVKIVKTIDEIAFQTNLLALNAAVEAARAGEAGAGFAVVADEVRNLAMRAAEAAKNTTDLIDNTIKTVREGDGLMDLTLEAFQKNMANAEKVHELIEEIAAASQEQAQGIEQIGKAVAEMDQVVQRNAANAEESASASQELNAQAYQMKNYVADLVALVGADKSTKSENRYDSESPQIADGGRESNGRRQARLLTHESSTLPKNGNGKNGKGVDPKMKGHFTGQAQSEQALYHDDEESKNF